MQSPSTATNDSPNGVTRHSQASADPAANGSSSSRSLRVIVADNDPAMRHFYQQVLARLGHHVCEAVTGRQLVEQSRSLRPDLVITGVKGADLDGVTASEEICRGQPTPIILVPGDHDTESVHRAFDNPCVLGCLFKPIKEADLGAAIALAMRRFEQIESLSKKAAGLRQALEDRKLIERAKGMVMRYAGLDEEEAFRRLRKMASDRNRKVIEVAQDILVAGEVFQQMEQSGESRSRGAGTPGVREPG